MNMELNEFGFEEDYERLATVLRKYPEIDGIFASNDALGIAAIKVANQLGKRVPQDIKIVGYDDVIISQISIPELTTIRQPIDDIGKTLVETLLWNKPLKKYHYKNHKYSFYH